MISVHRGFQDQERGRVAGLYWQAFGGKLGKVLGPGARALAFIEPLLDPRFALVARDEESRIVGLAGFKTARGGVLGGGLGDLARVYGWTGAVWRGALLAALEREVQPEVFQMDGICVDASARGHGIGTRLLDAIADAARARGLAEVQLDVIDTNSRARALYERRGFVATGDSHTGLLRHVFGFSLATRMRLVLAG